MSRRPGFRRLLVVIFSSGWVVPLWLSAMTAGGTVLDVLRFLASGETGWPSAATGMSFPVEEFALRSAAWEFTFGCVWLFIAVAYWSIRLTRGDSAVGERPNKRIKLTA